MERTLIVAPNKQVITTRGTTTMRLLLLWSLIFDYCSNLCCVAAISPIAAAIMNVKMANIPSCQQPTGSQNQQHYPIVRTLHSAVDSNTGSPIESSRNRESLNIKNAYRKVDSFDRNKDSKRSHHMIVHWDINETILIGDDAGGDSREDCMNKIIAKSAFVQIPHELRQLSDNNNSYLSCSKSTITLQPTHWWDGTPIHNYRDTNNYESSDNDIHNNLAVDSQILSCPPLYTGWVWPKHCCPYYRTSLKDNGPTFLDNDGRIYKRIYDLMEDKLRPVAMAARKNSSTIEQYPKVMANILPSFFETLMELFPSENQAASVDATVNLENSSESDAPAGVNEFSCQISIVLRTFGTDLEEIAKVVTMFAQGKHPMYPNYYNQKLIVPPNRLYKGRWKLNPVRTTTNTTNVANDKRIDTNKDYIWQLWENSNDQVCVAQNESESLQIIHSSTICGIQDDYPFWKQNNYQPWSGKPVWIVNNESYHHLLLDDNIHNLIDYSIAGIRRQTNDDSFEFLSNQDIIDQHGVHILRVPTIEPILNNRWFLEQIEDAYIRFRTGSIVS